MRARWGLRTLAAMHALMACSDAEENTTRTQVTLRVQGLEHAYFADLTHLQIEVFREDAPLQAVSRVRLEASQLRLPLDLPIVPVHPNALNVPFEVIVDALNGNTRLAQARAVTSYAVNSLRLLEVWLHSCVGQPAACVQDDCHGPECEVCDQTGKCVAAGVNEGLDLPFFNPVAPPMVKPAPAPN